MAWLVPWSLGPGAACALPHSTALRPPPWETETEKNLTLLALWHPKLLSSTPRNSSSQFFPVKLDFGGFPRALKKEEYFHI